MDFSIDFNLVRSQKLLMIPQLKQAIEILEMNSQELFHYIQNRVETNPALEVAINNGIVPGLRQNSSLNEGAEDDAEVLLGEIPQTTLSLKEHLLIRMDFICPDRCSYLIGEYLIYNTDENGYLKVEIREVAEHLGVSEELVLSVLEKLQSLDPPGICARDLRECLLLQLRAQEGADAETTEGEPRDDETEEAIIIVDRYLEALACDDVQAVAFSTGIPVERVRKLFNRVKELEPRPGREFFESGTENPIIADIIIHETNEGLQVLHNEEACPDICISESYVSNKAYFDIDTDESSVNERLNDAVWLIKCLEQREDIIFAIAQKLCEEEKSFFMKGVNELRPLEKASFAASMCMHESIVDKAVNGKYLQCRWGIYELGSFFEEQLLSTEVM